MVPSSVTADAYEQLRPLSFSIAYRMLGSVAEAEDIVQEAFLRLHRSGEDVEHPKAFLTTVTTRLAIDQLRSARARRETYTGPWLPEPVVTDSRPDDDSVSMALLVTLESLTPVERAVFLLHDVFDYGYDEIAEIVGKREENVRQLAVRARRHVGDRRPRFETSRQQRNELARRFFAAAQEGDLDGLEALLAHDVVLHGDGGGKVPALARSLHGRNRVARTLLAWARQGTRVAGLAIRHVDVNGQPGALLLDGEDRVISVMALDIAQGQVQGVSSIVNPDKLRHVGPVADMKALLKGPVPGR
jgi:RNA polymerase sigma-70 factor (TIGR02957 family)